ncbi:carbamoyl phosphate synthase-like protein [Planctomycetes bacterium Pan216]|uniref:Carbamoyl phosphate synthase-like protein n=1 Tax=Kolteria novifilia TaxID=2527975 RepID=A0A518B4X3_9BACT|nr:carbamoyl phosphate synthase-like protein [Planctomycetes bacterium Pan216]
MIAARSLSTQGVEVIGCDETPLMALSFSRHVSQTFLHAPSETGEEEFVKDLVQRVLDFKPPQGVPYVLMPVNHLTYVVARHAHRFEPLIKVAAPPIKSINRVYPKDRLVETARALGVPVPRTATMTKTDDLESLGRPFALPAFVKLPDSCAGVGIERVESQDELDATFFRFVEQFGVSEHRPVLLQEAVEGDDYCVTMLCDHGEVRASMVYRNLKTFPSESGFGVLRETVSAKPLEQVSARLLSMIGWHGVVQLDFRWDGTSDDSVHLIEINPRFWGGLFQSVASGIDYPWLLFQLCAHGEVPPSPSPAIGKRTRVPIVALLADLQERTDASPSTDLGRALRDGWKQLADGSLREALSTWGDGVLQSLDPSERISHIDQWWREHQEAEAEFSAREDPLALLGLLCVLGSLVRTGQLPEEIRRSGNSRWREFGESTTDGDA